MADHKHGSMDTRDQEKTFDGFVKIVTRSVIGIIVILIVLAIVGS